MRQAFKEWVIVVDALLRGEQIVIFREGGLREGRAGFQIDDRSGRDADFRTDEGTLRVVL